MPALVHNAGVATLVNLGFIVLALACSCGLPKRLADDGAQPAQTGAETERAEAGRPRTG